MLAITAVLYGSITDWTMDFKTLGPAFVDSIRASLDATLENPLVNDPRIVHVDFRTLTLDPVATIRDAYAHWGLPYTPEFENRMRAWLANPANGSNRYGRYDYTLEPFGLDASILEQSFTNYRKRFGLA
jgi:hypothetical protein